MRYLKFTFAFFALLLAGLTFAGATELYDRLIALKGVVSVEELEKGLFEERYAVMFEQPLDHRRPGKGHFEQRFVVAHTGFDRPTVLVTEGYGGARAVGTRYREELSEHLNANQVFVEHRYFGESTPEPRNWHYLNAEQAAADLHAVREALREIYPEKWVATGVSKGGENSLIYRMYYPEDVDVTVAYVGPVCFGVEDGRHEPFLDRVGTDEERATIREFQTEVLKRRKELVPLFDEYCKSKSYTFRTNIDEVFDLCVLEYPFSIWQWGTATSLIPAPDSPHQELLDHLIAIVSPDYFAVNDEPSFFVQAQRELGYYGYDTAPFEGLLSIRDARGYLPRIIADAAELGVDMFLLDDGWFGNKYPRSNDRAGLGDWQETRAKLPEGIGALTAAAKKEGVKFGLWIEPEMVNPKSELYEKYKDWVIHLPNREEYLYRNQMVLDLSNPAVQAFVFGVVDGLLTRCPEIAYFKWDCNSPITNIYSPYLGADKQSNLYVDYVRGLYRVLDRVAAKYPTLPMMLCSGGGGRTDYEGLRYFTEFWASDNTDPVERIFIQWGYSYLFPAKATAAHVTSCGFQSLKFRTDVAMMGKLGFDIRVDELSEPEREFARAAVANYNRLKPR